MTAALGSLVVSLGLDAAQYTQGLTRSEYQAKQFAAKLGQSIEAGAALAIGSLGAIGVAGAAAFAFLDRQAESIAAFQGLSDKIGDTAENVASLKRAADISGTSFESIAATSVKLTATLAKVDDESKGAAAGIAALGINFEAFKKQSPVEQLDALAQGFAKFEDGPAKTAVAIGILGKSGADMLGLFQDLADGAQRQVTLTQAQIDVADAYSKQTARLRSELDTLAQQTTADLLPAMSRLVSIIDDAAKWTTQAGAGFTLLQGAISGVTGVAQTLVIIGSDVAYVLKGVGTEIGGIAAQAAALMRLDFRGFSAISDAMTADADRARKELDRFQRSVLNPYVPSPNDQSEAEARRLGLSAPPKDRLKVPANLFGGGAKRGGGSGAASTAAAEARSQLAFDLDEIKDASEAIINTYTNQERIVSALHSAGLKDERDYYAAKQSLLELTTSAGADALMKQIERMKTESLLGKDQIDNLRKIKSFEADLAKFRANAAASAQVLSIQQQDALDKIAARFDAARAAAKSFADVVSSQNGRELAGLGKGGTQREKDARLAGREDEFRAASEGLLGQFRAGDISRADYQAFLAIQESAHQQALASDAAYWAKKAQLQTSWALGAREGLTNYFEGTQNAYDQMQKAGENAFKGLEDALVGFTQTGKFNFASFADSVAADILRISVRQQITGPLAQMLSGSLGGASGGGADIGSWFAGLFGRASGGSVQPWQMVRVNENGPEMLDYGGKQYLMNGARNSRVTPLGAGGGGNTSISVNVLPGATRETGYQAARDMARELQRAGRR